MTQFVSAAAIAVVTLLAALTTLQVLLAAGRPLGALAWGGQYRVLPRALRFASAATVLIYLIIAAVMLLRSGLMAGGRDLTVTAVGAWIAVVVFALGIPSNALSRSRPERLLMTPASVLLTAAALIVAAAQ